MLKPYQTIEDVLASPWARQPQAERMERTDRVLRSTKLENNIYHDLRAEDTAMDEIERSAGEKLRSFPALSQDVFQSFYSLMPRHNDETVLSSAARKFNAPILEHITQSGKQAPAGGGGHQTHRQQRDAKQGSCRRYRPSCSVRRVRKG